MKTTSPRILITGFGLITPLGNGSWPTFRSLLAGRRVTDRAAGLPNDIASAALVRSVGAINLAQHAAGDPAIELAERAAREALAMTQIGSRSNTNISSNANPDTQESCTWPTADLPCFLGTSKGAFHLFDQAASTFERGGNKQLTRNEKYAQVVAHGPHDYMSRILAQRLDLGTVHHTVAACASGLVALHHARQSLLHAPTDTRRALVIAADASLTPLLIHAYEKLGVLAPRDVKRYRCNPLDESRRGFVLAEAAAALVIERVDDTQPTDQDHDKPNDQRLKTDSNKVIELKHTAVACDSFDMIRTSPKLDALDHVHQTLTAKHNADLYHLHAPGTIDHDPRELALVMKNITAVSSPGPPDVYASKGALGHSLGASGLVSAVIACLCQLTNRRPPMPWLNEPIHAGSASQKPVNQSESTRAGTMRNQVIFASGFGGHTAGALIGPPNIEITAL